MAGEKTSIRGRKWVIVRVLPGLVIGMSTDMTRKNALVEGVKLTITTGIIANRAL